MIELISRGVLYMNDKILLCHRKWAWNTFLPGGHIDEGESAKEALRREFLEEIGERVEVRDLLGVVEHKFENRRSMTYELNLLFLVGLGENKNLADIKSREPHIEFIISNIRDLEKNKFEPHIIIPVLKEWIENPLPYRFISDIEGK